MNEIFKLYFAEGCLLFRHFLCLPPAIISCHLNFFLNVFKEYTVEFDL